MQFGYFTLSDNHYPDNPRSAGQFVLEIREQAILADRLGYHSAWIGEHHFDRLGVNSRPDIVLASIIPETRNIRLAPAVNVLPIHHPIHVAEMWATLDLLSGGRVDYACGRGYDRAEYIPFGADFMTSAEVFEEGLDVLHKAWTEPGMWSHHGPCYQIDDMEITPKPLQDPIPIYVGSFSRNSVELAARKGFNIAYAPFAAAMVFGGLKEAVDSYRETTEGHGKIPGRAICSYFIYIADTPEEEDLGRQYQIDYFQNCVLRAFPDDPSKMPPTMHYFMKINEILRNTKKEDLSDRSILIGSPAKIIHSLKSVEAAGIDEVILYFNVGRKPHAMVKEQMHRFAEEIAPAFA
ncbi:MAG: LLM class flavin-dependent oxidoreductase [Rhodospirillaceae bacterium]|jgi:alkanesulfonate monooxygenase SsuD/methylene tetrahydromethanopterin reductase-like flavin-dependent oxidoreductase (luciferase family)|nr:LLM class flavin-dependent oxidoreductase [Rhodospirillaceae bacterium]MBT5458083.1 LLM class flavin-dependent oxidoreductase [Rhodospirillaceae bacterium]